MIPKPRLNVRLGGQNYVGPNEINVICDAQEETAFFDLNQFGRQSMYRMDQHRC